MIHCTVLNVNEKSIRNLNEKPAQLFIGKTIEKTGSDTLIPLSASGPVFLLLSFFSVTFAMLASGRFQHIRFTKNAHQSDKFILGEFAIFDS